MKKSKMTKLIICLFLLIVGAFHVQIIYAADTPADGEYAIDLSMEGGSGKASVQTPALFIVKYGRYYARIIWSSSNYDYMIVDGVKYLNEAEEDAHSTFTIPVSAVDEDLKVIANTTAMGTPHEIEYTFHFYSDSVADKSTLPQEGAKRVLIMAGCIIVVGAIANYFTNKRRNRDFNG